MKRAKCTLLVPTRSRPDYLSRQLDYLESQKILWPVIVADSSPESIYRRNLKQAQKRTLKLQYQPRFPHELDLFLKLGQACKQVTTPYTLFCPDDDYMNFAMVERCLSFLEKNPDYSLAHGWYGAFSTSSRGTGQNPRFSWRPLYPLTSLEQSSPLERAQHHMSHYYPTLYALHRTRDLKISFKNIETAVNDPRFGELYPSLMSVLLGKVKVFPGLFCLREESAHSYGASSGRFKNFIDNGSFSSKYQRFKKGLHQSIRASALPQRHDINPSDIDTLMITYLENKLHIDPTQIVSLIG